MNAAQSFHEGVAFGIFVGLGMAFLACILNRAIVFALDVWDMRLESRRPDHTDQAGA